MTSYGVIGFGRIGRRLATRLLEKPDAPNLVAALARGEAAVAARALVGADRVCADLDEFIARRPAVAVECASAATLAAGAPKLLAAGIDVMPLSLCAFADEETEKRLRAAAEAGPGRFEIPPGAMASLDALAAAREDDLRRVVFRASKPAATWKRTRAAAMTDLDRSAGRYRFFAGSVREVAKLFPDLNLSVAVALAGLGLDRTETELYVDPATSQATFEIEIDAGPGPATITVRGRDVPPHADPLDYTTFSLMRLLRRRAARIAI